LILLMYYHQSERRLLQVSLCLVAFLQSRPSFPALLLAVKENFDRSGFPLMMIH
jgi:hypothetical protein